MKLFVDTSALYAVIDRSDPGNAEATASLEEHAENGFRLTTHDYVAVETSALVQRRLGMRAVSVLHEHLLPAIELRSVTAGARDAAVTALLASERRTVSLVDWVSFEVMRRQGIEVAFAFDEDFAAQGFTVVP